jgi:iron complex transport system substrate-binding protein
MIYALGAGNRVVGVSDFDRYPPEVLDLPKVGALIDPNLERILSLGPDLVVTYGTQSGLTARLDAIGIPSLGFVSESVDETLSFIRTLSEVLGDPHAGRDLAGSIRERLDTIRMQAGTARPTVLLVHSRDLGSLGGFYTEGRLSYLNELIEIAGGRNLFSDVALKVFQPSLEEILERGPDVIIELLPPSAGSLTAIPQRLGDWSRLTSVPAVRNGRVHVLADDYLLLNGPRLDEVAARLSESIGDADH